MFAIKDCTDYEVAKQLIREYSEIKGAESCFASLDKELADLGTYYKGGALLIGFEDEMSQGGIGTLSELYDGNPPFIGRGAVSYAPNVGGVLRVLRLFKNIGFINN